MKFCTAFSPIFPEAMTASVLTVETITVGVSTRLLDDGEDCCPVQSPLDRFPAEDNFIVA